VAEALSVSLRIMLGLGFDFGLSLGKSDEGAGQLAKVGRFSPNTADTNLPLPMSTIAVMKGLAHSCTSLRSVVFHCRRDGTSREHPEDLVFAAVHRRRLGAAQKRHHRVGLVNYDFASSSREIVYFTTPIGQLIRLLFWPFRAEACAICLHQRSRLCLVANANVYATEPAPMQMIRMGATDSISRAAM